MLQLRRVFWDPALLSRSKCYSAVEIQFHNGFWLPLRGLAVLLEASFLINFQNELRVISWLFTYGAKKSRTMAEANKLAVKHFDSSKKSDEKPKLLIMILKIHQIIRVHQLQPQCYCQRVASSQYCMDKLSSNPNFSCWTVFPGDRVFQISALSDSQNTRFPGTEP